MLLIALFLPRGLGLDRFVTVDEPKWLVRSASFYAALAHGNFQETFQREHPGVTITWAGTAGFLWRFPGYYKVVPDVSLTPTRFHNFLRNSGQSSLDLLVAGRLFVVLGIVVALGLAYLLAARMLGALPAAFAFLLVALDPFPVALSRLLHLDGLLSALMLLSLLAFTAYSYYGRRRGDLLLSAMAAGLAWLTKSPAFFLAPFFGLFILVEWVRGQRRTSAPSDATVAGQTRRPTPARIWWAISPLLLWFLVAAAVFVLLWPAMWVDPLGSLGGVFSQATTYASEGHEHPGLFYGKIYPGGDLPVYFYPVAYLWRATPVTLLGLALALLALLFPRRLRLEPDRRRFVAVLLVFSLLFTTFMSIGAKKFDRYLLPVFAPLDLVAALGYLVLIVPRRDKESQSPAVTQRYAPALLLGLALMGHAIGLLQTYPYYFNYYNPLLGGHRKAADMLLVGWGEGLDQAAAYLNEAERNEKTRAIAWYGDGCLSYFYEGSTIPIGLDTTLADLRKTDYVVLYRNQWQRQLPTEAFLDYFENLTPVYVVSIDGIEYVRIYRP
jgi:hypothetical protein